MKHLFTTLSLLLLCVGTAFCQDTEVDEIASAPCLNDIRFGSWGEKEWSDNDYYRILRHYLNDYASGEEEQVWEKVNPYKDIFTSPYAIYVAEPFIGGGMQLYITFMDDTSLTFFVWIYSFVGDDNTIEGYEVRALDIVEDFPVNYTPEEINRIIDESNGKYKLW